MGLRDFQGQLSLVSQEKDSDIYMVGQTNSNKFVYFLKKPYLQQ